jgi:hypothetical protein
MSMTVVIGLGVAIVWVLISILVALVVARMIRLRDQQRPRDDTPDGRATPDTSARSSQRSWKLRRPPPPEA